MKDNDLIRNIYLNKIFFFFIFLFKKENKFFINKIKEAITNNEKDLLFEIIQNNDINNINNYISKKNIKNKICAKIFISNNEEEISYMEFKSKNENYFFYCFKDNHLELSFSKIIKKVFESAKDTYINEFYFKNKGFLPELKEKRTILSSNNIIKKIDYDLKLFFIKKTNYNIKNIKENFIFFKIDEKNVDDL